ncbi:alpha/beta hydrolase [Pseudonocardia xishanensis]|uniref:Alpha/beta hydrolase n=1 Tax=Pseudonocardia xishanensis TaxID=630995 RepID=A0ABP8RUW3_9PSEU
MTQRYADGWVEIDGLPIHFTEWGSASAPPVLMLHGLNVQCHTWDPIAAQLADEYHVIAVDLRGHGDSGWSRAGYRVRSLAHDVHGLIEALGLGPVDLVGHSLGVRVGMAVAGERPATVRSLVLSDAGPETTRAGALAMREFVRSATSIRGFRDDAEAREYYVDLHPEWRAEFIDLHVRHQLRRNWAGKLVPKADPDVQWITGSVSVPDIGYLWSLTANLVMPTLVMAGRRSHIIDEDGVDKLAAALPAATVRWFDTGHYIPREQPEEFTAAVAEFLKRD